MITNFKTMDQLTFKTKSKEEKKIKVDGSGWTGSSELVLIMVTAEFIRFPSSELILFPGSMKPEPEPVLFPKIDYKCHLQSVNILYEK